jgi:hypothetical protein
LQFRRGAQLSAKRILSGLRNTWTFKILENIPVEAANSILHPDQNYTSHTVSSELSIRLRTNNKSKKQPPDAEDKLRLPVVGDCEGARKVK